MNGSKKAKYYRYLPALCVLALLLALALTSTVVAQVPGSVGPGFEPGSGPGSSVDPNQNDPDDQQPAPTAVPTQQTPGNGHVGPGNGAPGNGNGNGNGNGGMMPKPGPRVHAISGRIVMHAATPAQLVKSGDGLQYYFVGADGSTVTGPHIPSFSSLAEMYPSGAWVPLLDAPNPLTGKQVNVDYLPNEKKIRVFTYYPDNEYDTNKQYIFNFGSDFIINVEAW